MRTTVRRPKAVETCSLSYVESGDVADARAVAAAHRQLRAVAEHDEHRAAEAAVHFQNALHVHNRAAMDAQELARIEPRLDVADRLAHQMRRARRVQAHVFPF